MLLKLLFGINSCVQFCMILFEAKSRKYQGVFVVKGRVKTWQVRGIWSQNIIRNGESVYHMLQRKSIRVQTGNV